MRTCGLSLPLILVAIACAADSVQAAPTADQRKELAAIRTDLDKVPGLLRQKKIDEAAKIVQEAETRLVKVAKEAKLTARDRVVGGLIRLLQARKASLLKVQANDPTAGVSYERQVAPILKQNCVRCHGENPRGGLRLDTIAGLKKGGDGGPLAVAGNPKQSQIIQRLTAAGDARMPKGGRPLAQSQIQTIALWIQQGAKFDGDAGTIGGGKPGPDGKPEKVEIPKPTGNETVSFTKDVAPFMVNLCLRCHNDRQKRSGFSLETFEKLMIGGKSGRLVVPGDTAASRMWDLVGKQDPIKMPPGQAAITRSNHRNLETWIKEGAKFDGKDPKATLRSLVPTEEELKAERFAKMSDDDFLQHRRKNTEDQWSRVLTKEKPRFAETKELLVVGNVSDARLKQIGEWGEEHVDQLRKTFRDKSGMLFKGKLAVFVMKSRFDYEEFNTVVNRRNRTPEAMIGHAVVDPLYDDAYIVLQDVSDDGDETRPGMQINLIDHLTGAYMQRGGDKLPDWVIRGTGLALAAQVDPKNEYIAALRTRTPAILRTVQKPEAVFANGTFSPVDVGAVGYTLVDYLMRAGGGAKFGQFVAGLQKGNSLAAVTKSVYRTNPAKLAKLYASSVGRGGARKR